jgi:uncharacterized repeat protein (TIGR03803 family)
MKFFSPTSSFAAASRIAPAALLFLATIALHGQTYTTLNSFDSTDGAFPFPGVVQALDGNFYGTTYNGGANNQGAIYKITPGGTLTLVYSFCGKTNCTDGALPRAGLTLASNGNLYGSTVGGGANNRGSIFKVTTAGMLTTVYSFCALTSCDDGASPYGNLIQGSDGNFYGTTQQGGPKNLGVIFRVTPAGADTTLYTFCSLANCADGSRPASGLVQSSNGTFYGTTENGGAHTTCSGGGCGTVFKLVGTQLTTLYSFCAKTNCADGNNPVGGLVLASNGTLYGTNTAGGSVNATGTVFQLTPAGALTTLHTFCTQTGCPDGQVPFAGLVRATDGNLYGVASSGGTVGGGTIFKVTPSGAFTLLYNLCSLSACVDGKGPDGTLIQATNGNFYGTTFNGGTSDAGVVFSLSTGLGAFIQTVPTSGKVGTAVKILGSDLSGATSVTFNGKAASFKVVSSTEITTTVPTGATTGTVKVATPAGTLSSNLAFTVP